MSKDRIILSLEYLKKYYTTITELDIIPAVVDKCMVCGFLTMTHVASYQHVALVTRAAVTAHSVVALVVTLSICGAALINICKQDSGAVNVNTGKTSSWAVNSFSLLCFG